MERKSKYVLDAGAFLNLPSPPLPAVTAPSVIEEIKSVEKRALVESLIGEELEVRAPSEKSRRKVLAAVRETGDRLSETDVDILALALDTGGTLVTDDFGVQNVAAKLKIPFTGIEKIKRVRKYRKRCPICGKEYPADMKTCPKCGARLLPVSHTL